MLDSINADQKLYVLQCGNGYSCLGFDVAERWMRDVLAWLPEAKRPTYKNHTQSSDTAAWPAIGTRQHYNWYQAVMNAGRIHADATKRVAPRSLRRSSSAWKASAWKCATQTATRAAFGSASQPAGFLSIWKFHRATAWAVAVLTCWKVQPCAS